MKKSFEGKIKAEASLSQTNVFGNKPPSYLEGLILNKLNTTSQFNSTSLINSGSKTPQQIDES